MQVIILDTTFKNVCVLDVFESLIWTERYYGYGDFEIYTRVSDTVLAFVKENYYIWLKDSEQVMIIEEIQITTDFEEGNHIKIAGRSLESILNRRIVWSQTTVDSYFQTAIKKLLNENIINPTDTDRQISNFIFEDTTDERITSLKLSAQYTGDNLYDIILEACQLYEISFKITLNDNDQFVFKLYCGEDRSYDQDKNTAVVFSPSFDNLSVSNYIESIQEYKNITLVMGEDEGDDRKRLTVGEGTGLERRELYTDARDIQSEVREEDGTERTLTDEEYRALLETRGLEKLAEKIITHSFDGEVDSNGTYKYGVDFYKGDIVQVKDSIGIEFKVRIEEIIRSQDRNGIQIYPTFSVVED